MAPCTTSTSDTPISVASSASVRYLASATSNRTYRRPLLLLRILLKALYRLPSTSRAQAPLIRKDGLLHTYGPLAMAEPPLPRTPYIPMGRRGSTRHA